MRRRLPPEQRRNELLDIGARLFADQPYEDVLMDDVATRAGVTRALVYRYFPSKRDLFAAIYRRAADRLMEVTVLDPDRPLLEQIEAGIDAHLDFFLENARTALEANRGALAGDPGIQAIISDELAVLRARMLDASDLEGAARAAAGTALTGWLAFVRAACVDWLAARTMSRTELREMCVRTLVGAFGLDLEIGGTLPGLGSDTGGAATFRE